MPGPSGMPARQPVNIRASYVPKRRSGGRKKGRK